MPDTYRPLTAEDPVGTPCHHVDDKAEVSDRVLVHYGPDESWTRWRGVSVIHPTSKLRVRVPDPWGELLEAAKAIQGACYLDDNVLQRKGVTTIECAALVDLFAAIAAVEASQKGASDAH